MDIWYVNRGNDRNYNLLMILQQPCHAKLKLGISWMSCIKIHRSGEKICGSPM